MGRRNACIDEVRGYSLRSEDYSSYEESLIQIVSTGRDSRPEFSIFCFISFNSSAAISVTLVVPSPTFQRYFNKLWKSIKLICTSASCALEISTMAFPAGWTMSKSERIVAPSFEMVTVPTKKLKFRYQKNGRQREGFPFVEE